MSVVCLDYVSDINVKGSFKLQIGSRSN